MSDRETSDLDDDRVKTMLRDLAATFEGAGADIPMPDVTALQREKSRRTRAKVLAGSALAVLVLGAVVGALTIASPAPRVASPPPAVLHDRPVLAVSPAINLDILGGLRPVSINLASGSIQTTPPIVTAATSGARIDNGLPRAGYIVGTTADGDSTVSVSSNLQKLIHAWNGAQGMYPAPASNPLDVWLSRESDDSTQAQEVDQKERPVGPAVPIPHGSVVLGQVASGLVVMTGADPLETLEVWNPSNQQVVQNVGTFDAVATTPTTLVWSLGNVVHIDTVGSSGPITIDGPTNDRVLTMSVSPDGSSIAVLWRPAPGSPLATSQARMAANSSLALVDLSTGTSVTVPGSAGAVGPIAWTTDNSRVFFGQRSASSSSTVISTYAIGANDSLTLNIPRGDIPTPADFGPTNGSLIVWNSSPPVRP
jgi:hypothetical protein